MIPSTSTSTSKQRTARRSAAAVAALTAAACLFATASVAASGVDRIVTVAGIGTIGFSGDGGQATSAKLDYPVAGAVDAHGDLYIADDDNQRIRMVSPTGSITTVAGNGVAGFSGDGGQATSAQLDFPNAVAVDSHGDLYIADSGNNRVREVSPSGVITTVAGTGVPGFSGDGGAATAAELYLPTGVAVGPGGVLYIADALNERVREVHPNGMITTVAGTGALGFSGDGGPAGSAELDTPLAVATDTKGNLYIADSSNQRIRKVDSNGTITTIAGDGSAGFSGDSGQATSSELDFPRGVAVDPAGNVYIADLDNYRVRKVTPDGRITTIAGNGSNGNSGDGGQSSSAEVGAAYGVATDANGDLYVFDTSNARVREIANLAPTASFSDQLASDNPLKASFDASASTDSDGVIASYEWSFGDGQTASGQTSSHLYSSPGTYTVTLAVTADSGATSSATGTVTITAVAAQTPSTPTPAPPRAPTPLVPAPLHLLMTVLAPRTEHALAARTVTLAASCSVSCSVSTSATVGLDGGTFALPGENSSIRGGAERTFEIPLSSHLRTLIEGALADHHRPVVSLTVRGKANGDPAVRHLLVAIVG